MRMLALPGVYRPRSDSRLLIGALVQAAPLDGRSVLDLCTGSGVVAVAAARAGAEVTAVDLSRRAVASARLNARLNGVRLRALRGNLWAPLEGRRFDVIVANPPYLPVAGARRPAGAARAWDAGADGRALLDPICARAAEHLRPGGTLVLMQSSLSGLAETEHALAATGLHARVGARRAGPLGPIAAERREWLHEHGRLSADGGEVLVAFVATASPPQPAAPGQPVTAAAR